MPLDQMDALEAALREILATAEPPRWRLDLRWRLKQRREWVLACAKHGWPDWYWDAVKCGADPEQLIAINMLIYGYAPRTVPRPYLGG